MTTPTCGGSCFYATDCQGIEGQPHECTLPAEHGGKHQCCRCKVRFVVGFGAALRFVRYWATGTVHVLWPEESFTVTATTDEVSVVSLIPRALTMCGATYTLMLSGTPGDRFVSSVGEFNDEDTCGRCVRALGIDAPLAFEHPIPVG